MKTTPITLEVSLENEGTRAPYWLILDPRPMRGGDVGRLAGMVTGPFFSRAAAERHLSRSRHNYGKEALVWCASGHESEAYAEAYAEALRTCPRSPLDRWPAA